MKKISSLFTFSRANSNGNGNRLVACINNDTFVNASWLAKQTDLSESNLNLLVGSSIDVNYFAIDEVIAEAIVDAKGKVEVEAKLCTKANTIVKSFTVEYSIALTVAKMYKAA